MKHLVIAFLCCCLLGGCGSSMGSFEKDTINIQKLIQRINKKTSNDEWDFSLLNENSIDVTDFGFEGDADGDDIFQSILAVNPDQIMIFKINNHDVSSLKDNVRVYIEDMKQNSNYIAQFNTTIDSYKEVELGNYYIVVIGKDASNVIEFISEYA